jgi:hypothetical protein
VFMNDETERHGGTLSGEGAGMRKWGEAASPKIRNQTNFNGL